MPKGHAVAGYRSRFKPLNPESPYRRIWSSNHYKLKGLSLEQFKVITGKPCHYCGIEPILVNPYGATYEIYCHGNKKKPSTLEWYNTQWILYNGIDKKNPTKDYTDLDNLVPCCRDCNWMKGLMGYEKFIANCNRISNHQRLSENVMSPTSMNTDSNSLIQVGFSEQTYDRSNSAVLTAS